MNSIKKKPHTYIESSKNPRNELWITYQEVFWEEKSRVGEIRGQGTEEAIKSVLRDTRTIYPGGRGEIHEDGAEQKLLGVTDKLYGE